MVGSFKFALLGFFVFNYFIHFDSYAVTLNASAGAKAPYAFPAGIASTPPAKNVSKPQPSFTLPFYDIRFLPIGRVCFSSDNPNGTRSNSVRLDLLIRGGTLPYSNINFNFKNNAGEKIDQGYVSCAQELTYPIQPPAASASSSASASANVLDHANGTLTCTLKDQGVMYRGEFQSAYLTVSDSEGQIAKSVLRIFCGH